jgi:integrase
MNACFVVMDSAGNAANVYCQEHVVPLCDSALTILNGIERRDRDYVFGRTRAGGFSGWSKSKAEFDEIVKLKEPWTVHDLRRTVRTGLGGLGIAPHIAGATHLKMVIAQATGANLIALKSPR